MLSTYYQPTTDTLFFESLDVPVAELENKKALKVSWHAYKPDVTEALSLLLPRDAFVSDVLQMAKGMVKLDPEHGSGKLRLMEVWTNKIHKVRTPFHPSLCIQQGNHIIILQNVLWDKISRFFSFFFVIFSFF